MADEAVTVISGGSAGMGLAVALRVAADGGRIAVLGRRQTRLDHAVEMIGAAEARGVVSIQVDAIDEDEVIAAFAEIAERWGIINALVNAVGPSSAGGFDDLDDASWRAAFDQGVLTAVHCTRHALPLLRTAPWAVS